MPGVAFAKTASLYDLPTLPPSLPPVPTELPTLPPDAPTLPPALPHRVARYPRSAGGVLMFPISISAFRISSPYSLSTITRRRKEATPPRRLPPRCIPCCWGKRAARSLRLPMAIRSPTARTPRSPIPLANQWSHNSRMSLTYNTQAFLSGEGSFITGSFSQTTTLLDFAFSVSGRLAEARGRRPASEAVAPGSIGDASCHTGTAAPRRLSAAVAARVHDLSLQHLPQRGEETGRRPIDRVARLHPLSEVDVPIGTRYQPGGIALTSDVGNRRSTSATGNTARATQRGASTSARGHASRSPSCANSRRSTTAA